MFTKQTFNSKLMYGLILGLTVSFGCSKEEDMVEMAPESAMGARVSGDVAKFAIDASKASAATLGNSYSELSGVLQKAIAANAVTPSECGPTPFNYAINPYVMEFGDLEWEWYSLLSQINQLYTYLDNSEQYFGIEGQLTNFAAKHKRNLESFWDMKNEITLVGQHTSTLSDRDAIAAVYINFAGLSKEAAYANADYLIQEVIEPSVSFDTTPLLSLDGFANTGELIVIGDGIVQILTDAGVDEKIAFAGILGHEWAHQIQFNNFEEWYGVDRGDLVSTPESTRLTELEADFLTGYYLTHKRGGTYNWKRTEEFFKLFYNIGDCSFTSTGHHGTPNQRLAASRLGYIIAEETFPKGHILEADELHAIFMAAYSDIITNEIDSVEAHSRLNNAELSTIYNSILEREEELQAILNKN